MTEKLNLLGQRFNKLLVQEESTPYTHARQKKYRWACLCDCGKTTITTTEHLRSGHTQSCGCLGKQKRTESVTKHGCARVNKRTSTYRCWEDMKKRCYKTTAQNYKYYGAKGITVCDRWKSSFENFLLDMGEKPDEHEIDRINNDEGYHPSNCRWVTNQQNKRNMSNNRLVTIDDVTKCVAEWCEVFNINKHMVYQRIHRGWPQARWFETK